MVHLQVKETEERILGLLRHLSKEMQRQKKLPSQEAFQDLQAPAPDPSPVDCLLDHPFGSADSSQCTLSLHANTLLEKHTRMLTHSCACTTRAGVSGGRELVCVCVCVRERERVHVCV